MKRAIYLSVFVIGVMALCFNSCNVEEEPVKIKEIENTLQSVSYFADTLGLDPMVVLESFEKWNKAINEIGYPNAGYEIWLINKDDSDIKFMVEGHWPDQDTYTLIHEHKLYNDAYELFIDNIVGLVQVDYHRFTRIKK